MTHHHIGTDGCPECAARAKLQEIRDTLDCMREDLDELESQMETQENPSWPVFDAEEIGNNLLSLCGDFAYLRPLLEQRRNGIERDKRQSN